MRLRKMMRKRCELAFALVACVSSGFVGAQDAWVHGSWVNLRSAVGSTASVKVQLTTNTPVQVIAREGEWCAVRVAATAADGYLHCSFLGAEPLTLIKAKDQPGRQFWIAPSVERLIAYGALLRAGPAYQRMYEKLKEGEAARIQPWPEFEAAKRVMAAGVQPNVATEMDRGSEVNPEAMEFYKLLKPVPIKPSFFKTHGDIVLMAEASGDRLSAVTQSKVSVKVTAPPQGYVMRHEGPEISGISGFGDVGDVELTFTPSMLVYSLMPNGLLAGAHMSKQSLPGTPEYGASCGQTYGGGGVGLPTGANTDLLGMTPAAGFPRMPETSMPMASFVTAKPLTTKKLTIKSRAARVPDLQKAGRHGFGWDSSSLPMGTPKVVLHEVDFDGDGGADMLIWDAPSIGSMSGGLNLRRAWYVNINGRWYTAGVMDDQECT